MKVLSILFATVVYLGTICVLLILYGCYAALAFILGWVVTFFHGFSKKIGMCP